MTIRFLSKAEFSTQEENVPWLDFLKSDKKIKTSLKGLQKFTWHMKERKLPRFPLRVNCQGYYRAWYTSWTFEKRDHNRMVPSYSRWWSFEPRVFNDYQLKIWSLRCEWHNIFVLCLDQIKLGLIKIQCKKMLKA